MLFHFDSPESAERVSFRARGGDGRAADVPDPGADWSDVRFEPGRSREGSGTTADRVTVTISNYPFFAVWPGRSQTGLPIIVSMPVENN